MPLSWNEIKSRAITFSNEWKDEVSEDAEAKSFWDGFFHIFDISRRRVATFEQQVNLTSNASVGVRHLSSDPSPSPNGEGRKASGFIDLLWKGVILIEHKSRGKDLDKAYQQAKDYFPGLKEKELPRYILVSDFERFRLYDLEEHTQKEFKIEELVNNVNLFGFIAGYQKRTYKEQDPVNIEAAELMGKLHDKLKAIGYTGHDLELYLVRLLFCLFADDTNIFEKGIFNDYLELKTAEDGSDLARAIAELFQVLNTAQDKRFTNLDESLAAFPYVNGKLFEENLPLASFDSEMRKILLDCCLLDWGKISPAIFGSLFQSVMDEKARRNLGAHYTSEKNILKLIKPLFLDELWAEFEKAKNNNNALRKLHNKISRLRFLDPACGCGNFLIIAYRELRLLELEIVKLLLKNQSVTSINDYFLMDVDQFYGIEYEEFPAQIAQVAMWLIDHQMNMLASEAFGEYYVRLPLRKSATIKHGNALRIDWQSLIEPQLSDLWLRKKTAHSAMQNEPAGENFSMSPAATIRFDYILGNPPFIGKSLQNTSQKEDMYSIFQRVNGAGVLDYVTAWYMKAAQYMRDCQAELVEAMTGNSAKAEQPFDRLRVTVRCAFVSTNSISQGEQVGILWNELFNTYKIKIHFAHRTFKWGNEAKGNAAVHVVIIGFANYDIAEKLIYEYEHIKGEPDELKVKNINPYLVEGKDEFIAARTNPICNVSQMFKGNQPTDGGNFLFTDEEKNDFLQKEPEAEKFIKPFISAHEFINGEKRWCLWLVNATPFELRQLPKVLERIESVKQMRLKSTKHPTVKWAEYPTLFTENRQPKSNYILIPSHSSENRKYIPMGFMTKNDILNNSCFSIPNASLYEFGIISSLFHMFWVKYICGRLESRFRYSNTLVYNNFPWPENPTDKQKAEVEKGAQSVLDARLQFPNSSLADLYDPNTMPPVLVKAHQQLDKAVDLCYRSQPFTTEAKRIEFLFELYDKYTAGLFVKEKKGKKTTEKE